MRCVDLAVRAATTAAAVVLKAAEREVLVKKYHPGGLPVFEGAARTARLSERELQVLAARAAQPTPPSVAEMAAELGRCPATITRALKRIREPQTPEAAELLRRRGGRKRILNADQSAFLRSAAIKILTPTEAAKALLSVHGVRVSKWTVRSERRRSPIA